MKALCTFFLTLISAFAIAQFCYTAGNVIIYANYDGGALTINIDEDIPDLYIGVITYEDCAITVSGPYAANVTQVRYVGFQGNNDHCNLGLSGTTIQAPPGVVTDVSFMPSSVLTDPDGYGSMVCAYSCEEGNQGGCNTAEQVVAYFLDEFGGSLYYYYTQYNCWASEGYAISNGGNCCPVASPQAPNAIIELSESQICTGECITVSDASTGEPVTWIWQFAGTTGPTSQQNPGTLCYNQPGSYAITLAAYNTLGSSTITAFVDVVACEVSGCMYPQAVNYNPTATVDDLSCEFICNDACPGDFDDNGLVGVSDLLLFISLYGSTCPN